MEKTHKKFPLIGCIVAAVLIVVAGAVAFILAIGGKFTLTNDDNTFETPLKLALEQQNRKSRDHIMDIIERLNGFQEERLQTLLNRLEGSTGYESYWNMQEEFRKPGERVQDYTEKYGADYQFSYIIDSKEKLSEDRLVLMEDSYKKEGRQLLRRLERAKDTYDSEKWIALADALGLSKVDTQIAVDDMIGICKEWEEIEVTDGYKINLTITVTGRKLDGPKEDSTKTAYVYKINGIWVLSDNTLSLLTGLLHNFFPVWA